MKKNILIIILMFFALNGIVMAQDDPDSYTPHFQFRMWLEGDNPGADSLNQNWIDLDTWIYYLDTSSAKLGQDEIVRGIYIFQKAIGLASLTTTSTPNGIFFNSASGKMAMYQGGEIKNIAWYDDIVDQGLGDPSDYASQSGTNNFSAQNDFGGITNFLSQAFFGTSDNTGELFPPFYTGTNSPPDTRKSFYYNPTTHKLYVKEGSGVTKVFLDSLGVLELLVTDGYLPTSGTFTEATVNLAWESGQITPWKMTFGGEDAGRMIVMPIDKNDLITGELGAFRFYKSGDQGFQVHNGTDWVYYLPATGNRLTNTSNLKWLSGYMEPYNLILRDSAPTGYDYGSIWFSGGAMGGIYVGTDTENYLLYPSTAGVADQIADKISYGRYDSSAAATTEIDMTDNRPITCHIYQDNEPPTIININNYAPNEMVTFCIRDLQNESAVTINVKDGLRTITKSYGQLSVPSYQDGRWYIVTVLGVTDQYCEVTYRILPL